MEINNIWVNVHPDAFVRLLPSAWPTAWSGKRRQRSFSWKGMVTQKCTFFLAVWFLPLRDISRLFELFRVVALRLLCWCGNLEINCNEIHFFRTLFIYGLCIDHFSLLQVDIWLPTNSSRYAIRLIKTSLLLAKMVGYFLGWIMDKLLPKQNHDSKTGPMIVLWKLKCILYDTWIYAGICLIIEGSTSPSYLNLCRKF